MNGDSITEGANFFHWQWGRRVADVVTPRPRVYNYGFGGSTFASQIGNTNTWQAFYDATAPYNLATVAWGTNDILGGVSLAALQANCTAMMNEIIAANPWTIALCTILPRQAFSAGQETIRQDYNTWLRANFASLGATFLIDHAANPDLQNPADPIWYADGTHPTAAGQTSMGNWAGVAVQAWLDTL